MFAMARLVAEAVPGFLDEKGHWPRQTETMVCDGAAIVIGALMGTSPLTVFAESAVGVREGGRSGITSFIVAMGFGVSMFLSPIFSSIPPYATGPAIVLVGAMMMEHARYIEWNSIRTTVPAFLTIMLVSSMLGGAGATDVARHVATAAHHVLRGPGEEGDRWGVFLLTLVFLCALPRAADAAHLLDCVRHHLRPHVQHLPVAGRRRVGVLQDGAGLLQGQEDLPPLLARVCRHVVHCAR